MLTPRQNLFACLRHQMPQWVPVAGHVDPYNQPSKREMPADLAGQLANVQWSDQSIVAFSRYLGLDIMDFCAAPLACRHPNVQVVQQPDGHLLTTTWHTRLGDLRQVQRYCPDTSLWHTEEYQVKSADDLPLLAELFADQLFTLDDDRVRAMAERAALIGEDGIVMAALSGTPLGQMVRVHCGVETIAYLWADARAALHDTFRVMKDNHLRQFALAASVPGLDALLGMDDTSTTVISPAMFEEFCLAYTDRIADAVHAHGKYYFHHSCGLIKDLLPLYRQTRMDAVHAFTTPPLGNVTIAEGRRVLGPGIVIITSLDELFRDISDRAAVASSIARRFEEADPGDNFILCLAADPNKTIAETRFVAEQAKRHQRIKSLAHA